MAFLIGVPVITDRSTKQQTSGNLFNAPYTDDSYRCIGGYQEISCDKEVGIKQQNRNFDRRLRDRPCYVNYKV